MKIGDSDADRRQPDVLVVEDDDAIREGISELLDEQGYLVERVSDGAAALSALRGGLRPSLIVLDLCLPVMSGWQLCDEISRDPMLSPIPVIAISASGSTPPEGPVEFLPKPLDIPRLLAAVRIAGRTRLAPSPGTPLANPEPRRASCS